ncbi:hypothetical protein [Zunongwangia profunda]|uniref:hypothetical protein n=1 Tax=Zunongwangia profunda TaxID=398743 RepID=UPI001D181F3E|nr:hypothetical protein [Zunongwangia profunda]MCC4231040.1 hypothetical protein [Zunongwangia profunda]
MRHLCTGKQPHHCNVLNTSKVNTEAVDLAGIKGNLPAGRRGRYSYLEDGA